MTRFVIWIGLAAVIVATAVLSFHGLRDLALAVQIPSNLAWLLPVAVDAGAAVSCTAWLARDIPDDASRFARTMTWLLLAGTVVGNAAQLGMHAAGIVPPWWVAVAVGAIPPAVLGGTWHLAVLVGRTASTAVEAVAPDEADGPRTAPLDDRQVPEDPTDSWIIPDLRTWADGRRTVARPTPILQEVRDTYGLGWKRGRRVMALAGLPVPPAPALGAYEADDDHVRDDEDEREPSGVAS